MKTINTIDINDLNADWIKHSPRAKAEYKLLYGEDWASTDHTIDHPKNLFYFSNNEYIMNKIRQRGFDMSKLQFAVNQLKEQESSKNTLLLLEEMAFEFLDLKRQPLSFSEMEVPVREAVKRLGSYDQEILGGSVVDSYWVKEIYPDAVIYQFDSPSGTKLLKRGYSRNGDGSITLLDDAVEVEEKRDFIPVNNSKGDGNMSAKTSCCPEKVNELITNENTAYTESDREFLSNMDQNQMDKLFYSVVAVTANAGCDQKMFDEMKTEMAEMKKKLAANSSVKTADEFVKSAPPEIAAVLNAGLIELNRKKDILCKSITANARNTFSAEQLSVMDVQQLEAISALASPVDFSVNAGVGANSSTEETPYVSEVKLF